MIKYFYFAVFCTIGSLFLGISLLLKDGHLESSKTIMIVLTCIMNAAILIWDIQLYRNYKKK